MNEINHLDRKILRLLQTDAGLGLEDLGQRVGLSRNACWRRIKQMEESGVITGRVVRVDADQLGLGLTVFIQIKAPSHDSTWMSEFAKVTKTMEQIQGVYRMTGDLDYLIRAQVSDMADYDRLYQRLVSQLPIGDVSASFVMEAIKDSIAVPV